MKQKLIGLTLKRFLPQQAMKERPQKPNYMCTCTIVIIKNICCFLYLILFDVDLLARLASISSCIYDTTIILSSSLIAYVENS